jgi:hypothetical protein
MKVRHEYLRGKSKDRRTSFEEANISYHMVSGKQQKIKVAAPEGGLDKSFDFSRLWEIVPLNHTLFVACSSLIAVYALLSIW